MKSRQNIDDTDRAVKEIIRLRHPSSGEELVNIITKEMGLSREDAIESMLRLEDQEIIKFKAYTDTVPGDLIQYLQSPNSVWYMMVVALSIIAFLSTFIAPSINRLIYLRYAAASILLMFLPGLCVTRILYIGEKIGNLKLVAMSMGISISIISVIGIALNYTPWGISTPSVTNTTFLLVLVLSTFAVIREWRTLQGNE